MIDWGSFVLVAIASIASACLVVALYSFGLRLLSSAGRPPARGPATFTDAITVVSPAQAEKAARKARKATEKNPLNLEQVRAAIIGAYACFTVCGLAVLYGVYLVIPTFHQ